MDNFDYTYDEIREYLKRAQPHEAAKVDGLFTDEVLQMWESSGLSTRNKIQEAVEKLRNTKIGDN